MTSTSQNLLISQRFLILEAAKRGGMGTVYRALDRETGQPVAVKLLRPETNAAQDRHRFLREGQLLSQLQHPHIVRYVAHGHTDDGLPYLAMEWLEGEDLGQRLLRQGLTLSESLNLLRHVADALSTAHRLGILHRDLKPSNLFLPGGQIERVTVLDFGIARITSAGSMAGSTQTGAIVGTPQYMAPEQARGQRDLGPSVDIFSLGCVLYECLTGRPPFVAEHVVAILAKILFEEPPPLQALRPELPDAIDSLVRRMLAKDAAERPRDSMELRAILDGLTLRLPIEAPVQAEPGPAATLSTLEQRLVSVILASSKSQFETQATLAPEESRKLEDTIEGLQVALSLYGADVEYLAVDLLVATLLPDERRVATDQAAQAARIALALKERWPGAAIALSTGRGVLRERLPIGDAIDRAVKMLQLANDAPASGSVLIDDITAGLLDSRFEIGPLQNGMYALRSELASTDELRRLLGKPTPCVGREQELDTLERLFACCVEESRSHAVLVTAPPGMGKSRLRHEFLRRIRVRTDPVEILSSRGETMSAGSAYGLLRQALCRLCGIQGSAPAEAQRQRLVEPVGLRLPKEETQRVAEFLGELCGIPFSTEDRPQLHKARQDPWLMGEQISQALVDFLRAECSAQPLLWVLEDLHYADALSIKLIERVLLELEESPFFMLALARPEVKELFPNLWSGRVQEIPLRGLSKRACERLVLEVLGSSIPAEIVARLVQQAAGNALFLEELIRASAEGKGDELPETVLAMLQSRMARLGSEVRRVLRAGSLFGETFWRGAVAALLGWEKQSSDIDGCLHELVRAEILELRRESRFPDEEEYGFRHALMREAAYSLLTEEDRRTGHLQAAHYLEEKGERDLLVIAEHYRLGGELERTVPLYMQAGEQANRISALSEARQHYGAAYAALSKLPDSVENCRLRVDVLLRQVQFGMLADPPELNLFRMNEASALLSGIASDGKMGDGPSAADQRRGAWIDMLCGRVHYVRGQLGEAIAHYQKVLPVAESLGDEQLLAIPSHLIGAVLLTQGHAEKSRSLLRRAVALEERLDSDYERLRAVGYYATSLVMSGRYREGMALHDQVIARAAESNQPAGLSVSNLFRAVSLRLCGDFSTLLTSAEHTLELCQKSGDLLYIFVAMSLIGWAHSFLGHPQEALLYRNKARALEEDLGGRIGLTDWFAAGDAEIALRAGDYARASALAEALIPQLRRDGQLLALGLAQQVLGLAIGRRSAHRFQEADAHLLAALQVMEEAEQRLGAAILRLEWAHLLKLRGALAEAAALRNRAIAQFEQSGCPELVHEVEQAQSKHS